MGRAVVALLLGLLAGTAGAQAPDALADAAPDPLRQQRLVRIVRHDCGACHGMRLTGGLGPALTRDALADKPLDSLAATIVHGRPGTAMPPWRALLSDGDARWIAEQLARGFPAELPATSFGALR
jgi:cytochrome c55X